MNTTSVIEALVAWIIWNSSGAAVLILLILAVRFFAGTAMSARWRSNLWLLVIARLTIPLLPAISVSLPAKLAPSPNHIKSETTLSVAVIEDRNVAPNAAMHAEAAAPSTSLTRPQILIAVWLVGAGFLLARLLISSIRLARATARLQPVDNPKIVDLQRSCCELMGVAKTPPLLASDQHVAPALVGVLRPKILLPRSIESQLTLDEIRMVLLHELTHLRRRDVLQKYVVALLTAVHWFNPLLWIANSRIAADREFACDEAVLRITSRQNCRDYGLILLKLVEMINANRLPAGAVGTVERTSLVQRRIDMIASYASRTSRHSALARSAAASLVMIAGVSAIRAQTVAAFATPTSQEDSNNTRTYDIRSLLVEIPSFETVTAPAVVVERSAVNAGKGVAGESSKEADREKLARQLESWLKAAVGNDAKLSLSAGDGKLVVVAEPATQSRIAHLLEQVESRRAVLATIETRALTFPAFPKLKPELTDKIRISLAPGGSPVEISEDEIHQLLHAMQESPTSSIVTAPRVTLFDGQRSHVVVATSKAYLKSQVDRENAAGVETSAGVITLSNGTAVSIRPSVDADHVHIALDFDFESSHVLDPKTEPRSVTISVEKVHVNRTLSTSTGHTLLMNLDSASNADGRLRILLVRPTVIVTKIDPIRS